MWRRYFQRGRSGPSLIGSGGRIGPMMVNNGIGKDRLRRAERKKRKEEEDKERFPSRCREVGKKIGRSGMQRRGES
jgi:hypothetical protein